MAKKKPGDKFGFVTLVSVDSYFISFEDAVKAREDAELKYFGELKPEAREGK